jgi:hypothetical protein
MLPNRFATLLSIWYDVARGTLDRMKEASARPANCHRAITFLNSQSAPNPPCTRTLSSLQAGSVNKEN